MVAKKLAQPGATKVPKKGLLMLYVGRGKGKTTAAMGLAARAAGSGLRVFIVQFIKGEWPCGEREFFGAFRAARKRERTTKLGTIEFVTSGKGFIKILGDRKPFAVHQAAARQALAAARQALRSGKYDLVIMDEAISAVETKVLAVKDLLDIARRKPPLVHLLMTGHDAPRSLVAKADLVTEMKLVKHPYYKGVLAQRGIDF